MIDWDSVATRLRYGSERDMWTHLYITEHLAITGLADRFGVSHSTIRDALRRNGIKLRSRGGPNRGPDMHWPSDVELLRLAEEHGIKYISEKTGFSYSAVYKKIRKLRREQT
jgi:predicted DNA-binding protein YlxM (UPF0122 family)